MDCQIKEKIVYLKNANRIVAINKGFSFDHKYIIDDKYLLRVFSKKNAEQRRYEFDTIHTLERYSDYVPKAIEFDKIADSDFAYMILTYLPGRDGEAALNDLTEKEQYAAGLSSGKELKKLHALAAPADYPSWYTVKKNKSDKYLRELDKIQVDEQLKVMLGTYIKENEALLRDRPNTFQHDDFHPANLLIHEKSFAGIIDFGRMDWGDPIHDLHKLGFFSSRISIPFTKGIVDGYHVDTGIHDSFWELYALYSVMHIVSALVWGLKLSPETYEEMLRYSLDVIDDHEHFTRIVPKWYTK